MEPNSPHSSKELGSEFFPDSPSKNSGSHNFDFRLVNPEYRTQTNQHRLLAYRTEALTLWGLKPLSL